MLGWICCISAVAGNLDDGHREPHSWVAASKSKEEEAGLLRSFWEDIQQLSGHAGQVQWITRKGTRFDVPFLSTRSPRLLP